MDLFLHNLPPNISDNELKRYLTPLVNALRIKDWTCHKQRKKKFGSITFLHLKDGERFQKQYGQESSGVNGSGRPQYISHMTILDTPVYCTPSKYGPDRFLLKAIAKSAEERQEAEK
jgi:hypothetical protein